MVGLILCAIYIGFVAIQGGSLETAVHASTGFLWWWYWICSSILMAIVLVCGACGIGMCFVKKATAGLTLVFASLIVSMLIALQSACYILGTYSISIAGNGTIPFEQWDISKVVVGCVMLLLGIFLTICTQHAARNNNRG